MHPAAKYNDYDHPVAAGNPAHQNRSGWVSSGSPSQESQGAAVAAPPCAVARKFGEARIFGGTPTNPGWTTQQRLPAVAVARHRECPSPQVPVAAIDRVVEAWNGGLSRPSRHPASWGLSRLDACGATDPRVRPLARSAVGSRFDHRQTRREIARSISAASATSRLASPQRDQRNPANALRTGPTAEAVRPSPTRSCSRARTNSPRTTRRRRRPRETRDAIPRCPPNSQRQAGRRSAQFPPPCC
jgi:hypothetical protein